KLGLDAVLLCEHQYLDPKRAYSIMIEEKPHDSRVLLFAGVELVCRANDQQSCRRAHAELIVSTSDPSGGNLYAKCFLSHPGLLTFEEAVREVIGDSSLDCYVSHPYVLGKTGAVKCLGESEVCRLLAEHPKLGIEMHNGSFNLVYRILRSEPLIAYLIARVQATLFQGAQYLPTLDLIKRTRRTPDKLLFDETGQIRAGFFAGGSDAHFPENMTSHLVVPMESGPLGQTTDESCYRSYVYGAIVNNKSQRVVFNASAGCPFWFLRQWGTLIKEGWIKAGKKRIVRNTHVR
ncbi:MAG: hypothetical protein ACYS29_14805, partial [Planctomycetota bacterium]